MPFQVSVAVELLAAREPDLVAVRRAGSPCAGLVERVADAEDVVAPVAVGRDVRVDAVREP